MRLALLAALAPPYYLAVSAIATLLAPKEYRSSLHTMSQLAAPGVPHPRIINAGFIGYSALVQGLGPLLSREAGGGWRGRFLWGLVGAYGLGGILAGIFRAGSFRKVAPGVNENTAHRGASGLAFAAILGLMLLSPFALRPRSKWDRWGAFSRAMFAATCAFALPFHARSLRPRRGLLQRGVFATTMAWVFATSLKLRR